MRERAVLVAAVLVLFGGLGVWALVAGRGQPDPTLLLMRPPPPPIGVPARADEAGPEREILERAMLGGVPQVRLFDRAGVATFGIVVPGRDAVSVRDRIRAAGGSRVPIVLGDGWALEAHGQSAQTTSDAPDAIVRRAAAFDVEAWLRARVAELRTGEGAWPEDVEVDPRERYSVTRDRSIDLALPEVAIAMLPIADPAEAPAWLAFGNWSGCPDPTVHVAVLARWRDRFGAEVIAIGEDRIELRVARPPADRDAAMALAREQIAYAPALAAGGARTVASVAAGLVGARTWSLRWPRVTRVP